MIPALNAALSDRYSIVRELGRGGMATVYLALDLKLHRQVALKVLRPELAATLGPERFLREIEIAARLSHAHILPLHDSGEAGGHLYYAMPYVEGESLRQRLEREGQLAIGEVVAIVQAVASALTYAHQHGVVHRDIKPENILLAKHSSGGPFHPLVADFGIARALDAAGGERLTETGLALGTPAYMSPEQSAGDRRLDGRSDIYALGCVAYEMLAGQPPFTGPTAQAILARHAVDPPPPLHTVRATIPQAVEWAVERALAKVPADRFTTATEFAEALLADHVPRPRRRPARAVRRKRAVLGAAVTVTAAGVGAVVLRGSSLPAVVPSAATLAVLPFFAAGTDTALVRLGRDLAVTLSASLDGIGGIETADRLTVANATADRSNLSPAEGAALARRLNARSFLRGTLVRAGENVRLDLGLYSTEGLAPLAEGITVSAHRDSIGTLTDSAAWALVRQVWQRGDPPSPSLAAVTTSSLPALRAFLEGERELGGNQWEKAALAFRSSIAADSAFGLAHFRYALTRWWADQPVEPEIRDGLRLRGQGLPEQERLLVDAFLTNTLQLRIERYRAVTQRFPGYWPAWFLYADALFHQGPVAGYDWSEGLVAFRRVLALNPRLVPAWNHLMALALGKDHAIAAEAQARLVELRPEPMPVVFDMFERLDIGVSEAGGVTPPHLSALADSAAQLSASSTDEMVSTVYGPLGSLQQGFPSAQIDFNRRALRSSEVSPRVLIALRAADAWSWVARGQWDRGLAIMSEIANSDPVMLGPTVLPVESYGMAVLGTWLGAVRPSAADQLRPLAVAAIRQLTEERTRQHGHARLAWLDGLLAYARGDRAAIRTARKAAARSGWRQADLVDRSLAAFDQALTGDRQGAGRKLAELEEHCIDHEGCIPVTPHIAVQRLAAAQWLREDGELDMAARLLRWPEAAWIGWSWAFGHALAGPTYLVRAQIDQSRGRDSLAEEYYRQFLRRYDQPMPSQAHLVEEARTALARLKRR